MRLALAGVVSTAALLVAAAAHAESSKDDWFDDGCADKSRRWCAPKLREGGWVLKYRTESPKELQDVSWLIEVWIKGKDALVCELRSGRAGIKSNGCYSLTEVSGGRP